MKISCGVLFIKNKKILVAHACRQDKWDIPKGQPERNENYEEAAIRECREETGFEILAEDLMPIGVKDYTNSKKLALFVYTGEEYPDINKCRCSTTCVDSRTGKEMIDPITGKGIVEMDDYKYISYEEFDSHCSVPLANLLKEIFDQFYGKKVA